MTLHAKVTGDGLDGEHLSVSPLYALDGESTTVPKHRLPDGPMVPEMAYEIIHNELMLDGNAHLNLATFVTTWMEPQAEKLMAECLDKNMIGKDEYPQTAELEIRCRTTESEILETFPARGASLTRDQGLSLVREDCRRMNEQVSTLRRRYDESPPGDEHDPEVARVIYIRDSPTVFAEGAHPASVDDAQATARAADTELA